jgi:putative NIF3 family GTP cyclohydrolase 1 type 2
MTTVYDIYSFIEDIAPYHLQEGYDNSGLNVGEMSAEVRSVLVALDCTAEVAREACQRDFDLVLTHHPVISAGTISPILSFVASLNDFLYHSIFSFV